MAQCKDCIHERMCIHNKNIENDTYAYMGIKYDTEKCKHYMTKDVVPKSEVEQLERNLEQCENGYRQEMHLLQCKLADEQSKIGEIFEEIDNKLHDMAMEYHNAGHPKYFAVCEMVHHKVIRQVEKKYTESEGK